MTQERNARVKPSAQTPNFEGRPAREAEKPLSPARGFVVQFREDAEGAGGRFTGRVEHMMSGQAARFESPEELRAFFVHVLTAVRTKGSEER